VRLTAQAERWPLAGAFTIACDSKTEARVVSVEIKAAGAVGRGGVTTRQTALWG
jgi:hypothetical protein